MRRVVGLSVVGAVLLILIGCALPGSDSRSGLWAYPHARMETLSLTPEEHEHYVLRILEQDRRTLADDLDLLFMTDRNSRLSRWHDR